MAAEICDPNWPASCPGGMGRSHALDFLTSKLSGARQRVRSNDLSGSVSRVFGGNRFAFTPTCAQLKHYGRMETGKKPYRPVEPPEKWTWLQDACTSSGGVTFSKTTTWPSALDEQRFL